MHPEVTNDRLTGIINTYGDMVYRLALSYTKNPDDAEDVFQDVFLKLVQHVWKLNDEDHVRYWLVRVTINFCKKTFRKRNRTVSLESIDNENPDELLPWQISDISPEDTVLTEELRTAIRQALNDLRPEEYRAVLYLYYYEQFSIEEIANVMNLTYGSAKTKLSRARAKMKTILIGLGVTQWTI